MNLGIVRAIPIVLLLAGCATQEEMASEGAPEAPAQEAAETETTVVTDTTVTDSGVTEAAVSEPAAPLQDSFAVYFTLDSWILTDQAEETLDDAVAAADAGAGSRFAVVGHSDAVGAERQNERMSKLRAEAVADALIARGIPNSAIDVSWQGANDLAVATAGGTPEQANRRVTIALE